MIRPALRDIELCLCVEPVDFRKQVSGLSMLVESELSLDPLLSAVFAFTNRRGNLCARLRRKANYLMKRSAQMGRGRFFRSRAVPNPEGC